MGRAALTRAPVASATMRSISEASSAGSVAVAALSGICVQVDAIDARHQFVVRRLDIDPGRIKRGMPEQARQADQIMRVCSEIAGGEGRHAADTRRAKTHM